MPQYKYLEGGEFNLIRFENFKQDIESINEKFNLNIQCDFDNSRHDNSKVSEFIGDENPNTLKKIILENTLDSSKTTIDVNGAFIAIGHDPATSLFIDKLKMDEENYIITKPDSTETSIKGVFAAGDVKDKIYRQAVTAAGMGCMAALEAEKYIAES